MDAFGGPVLFPVHQEFILGLERLEAPAGERGVLRMLDCVFNSTLAIRIAYAGRVGDDAVMFKHRGVKAVDLRFIQVGRDHALP